MTHALADAGVAIVTTAPASRPVPAVIRLARAGVVVCAGSDGIRDTWGPYGNADMLERAMFIGLRSNLRRDDDLRIALDIVTTGGATALGLPDYGLTPGCVGCGQDGGRGCGPAAGDANGRKTWACYCPGRTSRSGLACEHRQSFIVTIITGRRTLDPGRSAQCGAVPHVFRCLDGSDMAVHRRQLARSRIRPANGRTALITCSDGARGGPSPWSTGCTIITFQLGKVRSNDWATGWSSRGWFSDGPTTTGVLRPIASATIDNARLSATPCASLLSELKLHGANSTTPRSGRGRMGRSASAH
jgi:amidohydrolase family protein